MIGNISLVADAWYKVDSGSGSYNFSGKGPQVGNAYHGGDGADRICCVSVFSKEKTFFI